MIPRQLPHSLYRSFQIPSVSLSASVYRCCGNRCKLSYELYILAADEQSELQNFMIFFFSSLLIGLFKANNCLCFFWPTFYTKAEQRACQAGLCREKLRCSFVESKTLFT